MFCRSCGKELSDNSRFCPVCGAPVAEQTKEYSDPQTRVYGAPQTKVYGDAFDGGDAFESRPVEDSPTVMIDGIDVEPQYPPRYAQAINQDNPYSSSGAYPQKQSSGDYRDSFVMENTPRFQESSWQDPSRSRRKAYHPTTAGRRVASFFVCLLMLLFGFAALLIGSSRIAFTESNVRKAYHKGSLADLKVDTDEGEKTLTRILMDNVVDSETYLPIPLEETAVNLFLSGSRINTFAENLAVDFTQFFIFGRKPSLLNGAAVTEFLTSISDEIKDSIAYPMSAGDIRYIGQRIDGGDLSFLSIDENGNYFKQKYGVDPYVISTAFSVWMLILSAGLFVLCIVLVFVIHHGNLPAGLAANGKAFIFFGVINTLIAAGLLVFSFIKNIFLVSELIRGFAFVMGGISIAVLIVGIVFSVIKTVLKNRI